MRSIFRFGLCIFVVGCGGSITSIDDGGADAGSDAIKLDGSPCHYGQPQCEGHCPLSAPAQGTSCDYQEGLACEYGSSPDPSCNQLFKCTNNAWQDVSSGTICPPPTDCPSTYASITAGNDCTPNGLACGYTEGTCLCTTSFGAQKLTPAWSCIPATSECPSPRPDIGDHCFGSTTCDYGGCQGGVTLQCKNGNWVQTFTPCPD